MVRGFGATRALGNFLSGMETPRASACRIGGTGLLGNFLSGMETGPQRQRGFPSQEPWKLP